MTKKKVTPQEIKQDFRELIEDFPDLREEFRDMCHSLQQDEDINEISLDSKAKAWYIRGILESMADKVWEIIKKF